MSEVSRVQGSAPPLATEVASLIKKVTLSLRSHIRAFKGSAPPLTAEAASLIEKETPALRSHIREVQRFKIPSLAEAGFSAFLKFSHFKFSFSTFPLT
jgi:hypothetical protein